MDSRTQRYYFTKSSLHVLVLPTGILRHVALSGGKCYFLPTGYTRSPQASRYCELGARLLKPANRIPGHPAEE
jgi:hypothetical protein